MSAPPKHVYVIGTHAFVPAGAGGLWIRTHVCVTLVSCSMCKAPINEPCRNKEQRWSQTHWARRRDAAKNCSSALDRTGDKLIIRAKH